VERIRLPPEARSVAAARRFVAALISDVVDRPHDVVLMTSELVANVVRHARTDVTVAVDLGPPTRVEVRDGAAATDAFRDMVRRPTPVLLSASGGRGLGIVHDLATRIGLDDDPEGGKVIWFEC
jgi:anti-sigma regulatory factor (Ser/Thr protein kinase)